MVIQITRLKQDFKYLQMHANTPYSEEFNLHRKTGMDVIYIFILLHFLALSQG